MVSKELSVSSGTYQKADLISARVNTLALQILSNRNWLFRAFQCSVQRSAVYTESNAILSRRLVHDGLSAHPSTGLSYFLKDSLFLEIFYFCNKVAVYREGYLSGSSFLRRDVIPCVEV